MTTKTFIDKLIAKDLRVVDRIAERAAGLCLSHNMIAPADEASCRADITAELTVVHTRIKPLLLNDLLAAGDDDFMRDIIGIHRHLRAGEDGGAVLVGGYMPKFAFAGVEGCLPRMPSAGR